MKFAYETELRLLLFREAVRARVRQAKSILKKKKPRTNPIADYPSRPDGIAIVEIFKNESLYLAEWLEFHLMLGVNHIYLYDNGSTDNYSSIVSPYIKDGLVTIIPWRNFSGANMQVLAYGHALANFGMHYKWIAFIDVDEFMFPVRGNSLSETLKKLQHLPAISMPWFMYGHGGHDRKPDGLVIKNFIERASFPLIASQYTLLKYKSIVNPRKISSVGIHSFSTVNEGDVLINDRGKIYPHHQMRVLKYATADHIRLNHYFIRSKEEFLAKLKKGRVDKPGIIDMHHLDQRVEQYHRHIETDTEIWRFIPELERRLALRFSEKQQNSIEENIPVPASDQMP